MFSTSNRSRPLAVRRCQDNPFQASGLSQPGRTSRLGVVKNSDTVRFSAGTSPKEPFDLANPSEGYAVSIVKAEEASKEAPQVVEFIENVFGDIEDKSQYLQNFEQGLSSGNYTTYLIRDTNTRQAKPPIIGSATLTSDGFIFAVCVDEKHQRRGIGFAMVQSLAQKAKEQGLSNAHLDVKCDNARAIGVYERAGFIRMHCDRNGIDKMVKPFTLGQRLLCYLQSGFNLLCKKAMGWIKDLFQPKASADKEPLAV